MVGLGRLRCGGCIIWIVSKVMVLDWMILSVSLLVMMVSIFVFKIW